MKKAAAKSVVYEKDYRQHMQDVNKLIDGLTMRGKIVNPYRLHEQTTDKQLEQEKSKKKIKEYLFNNAKSVLERYHEFKKLDQTWIEELASELDLEVPVNRRELKDKLQWAMEFEVEGYQRLQAIIERIHTSQGRLKLINRSIKMLQENYPEYYEYIDASYLQKEAPSVDQQLKYLKEKYRKELKIGAYYYNRKNAIGKLSFIMFGFESKDEDYLFFLADYLNNQE